MAKADAIRNPDAAFGMKVEVKSSSDEAHVFDVKIKGNNQTLITTLEPMRDKGRDLLMKDDNMWAYIPGLHRAVRVSLGQKLTGEAANGDISRMRWKDDYTASIESETPKEWILFLTAKRKGMTYEKIRAHVAKGSFRPVSAEYLTAQGKPLKLASFEDFAVLAGKERPSLIVIKDAVRPDQVSRIKISEMTIQNLSDSTFGLEKFQAR